MTAGSFIARALLAIAALLALKRTLAGWAWLPPAIGAVIGGMLVVAGIRTLRRNRLWALVVGPIAALMYLTWIVIPEESFYGLPSPAVLERARELLASGWDSILVGTAPLSPSAGILTLIILGGMTLGLLSAMLDGVWVTVPHAVIFVSASAIGLPGGRWGYLVLFLVAGLTYLAVETASPDRMRPADLGLSVRLGTLSIVAALLIPSAVPGFGNTFQPDIFGELPGRRNILSPMVQIRPRLVNPDGSVMFRVSSSKGTYWRLASLDRFDGQAWSLRGTFDETQGTTGFIFAPTGPTEAVRQNFLIEELRGQWVPTAYSAISLSGLAFRSERERDTLIVDDLVKGQTFSVLSEIPAPTASDLRNATVDAVPEGTLDLPSSVSDQVEEITRGITEGAATPYDAAVAIQNHLRTFTYSLTVPGRHDGDFLVRFLTETRAGYCEQFAASMAVMLRTIGIPSRVAVGFLPGKPEQQGYTVTNQDAHAWTEAYFDGIGWVAFEPTPRAAVDPPTYTSDEEPPEEAPEAPAPEESEEDVPVPPAPEFPDIGEVRTSPDQTPLAIATRASIRLGAGIVLLLVFAVASRWLALLILHRGLRRSVGPQRAAFEEILLLLEDVYRPRGVAETEYEYTRSALKALALDPDDLGEALIGYWRLNYGPEAPPDDHYVSKVQRIRRQLRRKASLKGKLALVLSPRPALRVGQLLAARLLATSSSSAARNVSMNSSRSRRYSATP